MKIRNYFQFIGLRGKTVRYNYTVTTRDLGIYGVFDYATWNHPAVKGAHIDAGHIDAYAKIISEGDFCIDIGAFSGDSTLPIAVAAGPAGTVLALEPNCYVYPVLAKNARLNHGKYNIIPIMAAAGETEGEMIFNYSDPGFCNGGKHQDISKFVHGHPFELSVYAVNLADELESDYIHLLNKLSFIKIDSEGYDLYVLRSMLRIIDRYRPVIKAEVFKNTSNTYRSEMFKFFFDLDYNIFILESEPCCPGNKLNLDDINIDKHYDIIAVP